MKLGIVILVVIASFLGRIEGFSIPATTGQISTTTNSITGLFVERNQDGSITDNPTVVGDDWETAEESLINSKVVRFLEVKYPTFFKLLVRDNDTFLKELQSSTEHTIFVPNEEALEALGAKKLQQLLDPRNEEIRDKMGQFHLLVGKAISATELRTEDWTKGRPKDGGKPNTLIAAIVTKAGEVPVGRSKSGGFFGDWSKGGRRRCYRPRSSDHSELQGGGLPRP